MYTKVYIFLHKYPTAYFLLGRKNLRVEAKIEFTFLEDGFNDIKTDKFGE